MRAVRETESCLSMSVCDGADGGDGGGDGEGVVSAGVTSHLSRAACQNTREFGNKLRHYSLIWESDRPAPVQLIIFPAGNVD